MPSHLSPRLLRAWADGVPDGRLHRQASTGSDRAGVHSSWRSLIGAGGDDRRPRSPHTMSAGVSLIWGWTPGYARAGQVDLSAEAGSTTVEASFWDRRRYDDPEHPRAGTGHQAKVCSLRA